MPFGETKNTTRRANRIRFGVNERTEFSIPVLCTGIVFNGTNWGYAILRLHILGTRPIPCSHNSFSIQYFSYFLNHDVTCTIRRYLDGIRYDPGWCGTRNEGANQETAYQVANKGASYQVANQEAGDQVANQGSGDQGANQETAYQGPSQGAIAQAVGIESDTAPPIGSPIP